MPMGDQSAIQTQTTTTMRGGVLEPLDHENTPLQAVIVKNGKIFIDNIEPLPSSSRSEDRNNSSNNNDENVPAMKTKTSPARRNSGPEMDEFDAQDADADDDDCVVDDDDGNVDHSKFSQEAFDSFMQAGDNEEDHHLEDSILTATHGQRQKPPRQTQHFSSNIQVPTTKTASSSSQSSPLVNGGAHTHNGFLELEDEEDLLTHRDDHIYLKQDFGAVDGLYFIREILPPSGQYYDAENSRHRDYGSSRGERGSMSNGIPRSRGGNAHYSNGGNSNHLDRRDPSPVPTLRSRPSSGGCRRRDSLNMEEYSCSFTEDIDSNHMVIEDEDSWRYVPLYPDTYYG